MTNRPLWASEDFWRKTAIWTTAVMTVILISLTLHSISVTSVGGKRVPGFSVINHRIDYTFDSVSNRSLPFIGEEAPLFGKSLSEEEAGALVAHGKKTVQGKNCVGCHTFLGNGSYFAPDLTKAWLDPQWKVMQLVTQTPSREEAMAKFLQDPAQYAMGFGSSRKMPNLGLTPEEAKAVVAYLKWMSAIDTNGFPANFKTGEEEGESERHDESREGGKR